VVTLPGCTASEENNSLQLPIVEEVIEGPNAAILTIWIRCQVWVVAENAVITKLMNEHYQLFSASNIMGTKL
jgi:hypothetical protein